jgi:hypothetical protein
MTPTFYQIVHKISSSSNELYTFKTNRNMSEQTAKKDYTTVAWEIEYNYIDHADMLVKLLLDVLVMTPLKENIKTKFDYFKTCIDNNFITETQKAAFVYLFCKAQRHNFLLNRLVRRYKMSTAPISVKEDLFMNPLRESQCNVITILQNGQRYLFTVNDLKTIIETAVCNTCYYYAEPLPVKNPYNNMVFDKGILYNIYFFMKRGDFVMSDVFHKYFLVNFNLKAFREINEVLIRNHYLENEVKNGDIDMLYNNVIVMFAENRHGRRIQIDRKFPKKTLVEIMRPYLLLYMKKIYCLDLYKKFQCAYELKQRLKEFVEFNPNFGRKLFKTLDSGFRVQVFHEQHIKFKVSNSLDDFYINHTEVVEDKCYDLDIYEDDVSVSGDERDR